MRRLTCNIRPGRTLWWLSATGCDRGVRVLWSDVLKIMRQAVILLRCSWRTW